MHPFSVCVFCGARPGKSPKFTEIAREFGQRLADENMRLVYGAGDVGIMGEVARTVQAAGGETFGVIPQHLEQAEVGKSDLSTYVVTETMHERKKVMFMNADAVVLLPGGAGSLDEFFEVLTWAQLDLHAKPILVMNAEGYWDPLIALIDHVIAQEFADKSIKTLFKTETSIEDLMSSLDAKRSQRGG